MSEYTTHYLDGRSVELFVDKWLAMKGYISKCMRQYNLPYDLIVIKPPKKKYIVQIRSTKRNEPDILDQNINMLLESAKQLDCVPLICIVYTSPRDFIMSDLQGNIIEQNLKKEIKKYKLSISNDIPRQKQRVIGDNFNYKNGRNMELRLDSWLTYNGFITQQTKGSKNSYDIILIDPFKNTNNTYILQIKSYTKQPSISCQNKEWLISDALQMKCIPLICLVNMNNLQFYIMHADGSLFLSNYTNKQLLQQQSDIIKNICHKQYKLQNGKN